MADESIEWHIGEALLDRVRTLVVSPVLPIAWPNITFDPAKDGPGGYIRVQHLPNTNNRLFIGSDEPSQRLGLLQLSVFSPLDEGEQKSREIGGQIAAHFSTDTRMVHGGIAVRSVKHPDVGPTLTDGPYIQTPVTVEYDVYA